MNVHEELATYKDLTPDIVLKLASGLLLEKLQRGKQLSSPILTAQYIQSVLKQEPFEHFLVIYLDTRHRVIASEVPFKGTIDGACVYPRVIAARALELNAAAIIVAHNHPSGDASPSTADKALTTRLKDALSLLEIRLLDHFVIGDGEPVSMAAKGLL